MHKKKEFVKRTPGILNACHTHIITYEIYELYIYALRLNYLYNQITEVIHSLFAKCYISNHVTYIQLKTYLSLPAV